MSAGVAVVGAGPAGLRAAQILAEAGWSVDLYDRMPSPARKLLMAGLSGLNLTNDEPTERHVQRFGAAAPLFCDLLSNFGAAELQSWAAALGVETFVGSSGRIFPVGMKAAPLVRAWLRRLGDLGVRFHPRHDWLGWSGEGALAFSSPDGPGAVMADATVLALGGASWPRLGSDGRWTSSLAQMGVALSPFRPANMGFFIAWSPVFQARCAGRPIKNAALAFAGQRVRGEFVITGRGIEGGAVYPLSAALRDAVDQAGEATVTVDLKPDLEAAQVLERLRKGWGAQSTANVLRKALRFDDVHALLLREATAPEVMRDPARLAQAVKTLPLRLVGYAAIDRALSSAGGVRLDEVDGTLMLKRRPGVFLAGEMLDWEAPSGGYLIHGCMAMGGRAAEGASRWLIRADSREAQRR